MANRVLRVSLIFFVLAGCNSKVMVPLKGSVTADGKPLAGANVMMFLDGNDRGQTAAAVTGEDGVFSISTGVDMGITPGTYTVTITWPDPAIKPTPEQMMTGNRPDAPDLLDGKYASRANSTIKAEVTPDTLVLEPFEVIVPEKKPTVSAAPVDDGTVTIKAPETPLNFDTPPK
ncbi:MAG: carboxypeptidase regulatory-like domain-containing protein [Planctomycetaceae bacterium]|nr:carboxypeptidase regulatory-like domain-containing protein [Planctomycetaceae bacterium]